MKRIVGRKIFASVLIPIVIIILSTEILAQTEKWKRQNDRGNRYEGRIEIPVGKHDLELLSFVGLREPFTGDVKLRVKFFLPASSSVFIQARELLEQKQYWMGSKPANWRAGVWNEFGPWPTGVVLNREKIPSWNLGVVISLRKGTTGANELPPAFITGGQLAPAFVYHSTSPASVDKYILHLRPNSTLKKVTYSLYKILDNQEAEVRASSLYGDKIAGEPFKIELKVRGLSEGQMRLVIEGTFKNRIGGPIREYEFYHKPQIR